GIAAWPVDTFVKHNDFSGKTVIPFATSASSGLGDSGRQLQQMAGTGSWLEGKRFPSNVSESTVQQWVQSLNR
ncbi:MAG: flavodoxin, partial [Megasphaera elsdenii]|nr:flavodoxin [Megasphaera elsdenii]